MTYRHLAEEYIDESRVCFRVANQDVSESETFDAKNHG